MSHPRSACGPAKPDPRQPLDGMQARRALRRQRGFTLVELLVVALIGGVLVSALLQAFGQVRARGRRADAVDALLALQSAQERHHFRHGRYALALRDLGQAAQSRQGHWQLALLSADDQGWRAVARRIDHDADTDCAEMTLQVEGLQTVQGPRAGCWQD